MKTYAPCTSPPTPTPGDAGDARARRPRQGRLLLGGLRLHRSSGSSAHRLWIAGLIVLVAAAALGVALQLLRVGAGAGFSAAFLFAVLVGLEANSLRRWTLAPKRPPPPSTWSRPAIARKPRPRRSPAGSATRPSGPAAPARRAAARRPIARAEPVIGLFPGSGADAVSVAIIDYGSGNLHSAAQGFRARRPRGRRRRGDRRHRPIPRRSRRPTASCCPASARLRIAGAASTRSPAWSRP